MLSPETRAAAARKKGRVAQHLFRKEWMSFLERICHVCGVRGTWAAEVCSIHREHLQLSGASHQPWEGVLGQEEAISAGVDTKAHEASQPGGAETSLDSLSNILHLTPSPARRAELRESLIPGKSTVWATGLKNLVGFKNLPYPGFFSPVAQTGECWAVSPKVS